MTSLLFQCVLIDRQAALGFYKTRCSPSAPPYLYCLMAGENLIDTDDLPAEDVWKNYICCFLFSSGEITLASSADLSVLAQKIGFTGDEKKLRMFVWMDDKKSCNLSSLKSAIGREFKAQTGTDLSIPFGNINVFIPIGIWLEPDFFNNSFKFQDTSPSLRRKNTSMVRFESLTLDLAPFAGKAGRFFSGREAWDSRRFFSLFRDNFDEPGVAWGG